LLLLLSIVIRITMFSLLLLLLLWSWRLCWHFWTNRFVLFEKQTTKTKKNEQKSNINIKHP